MNDLTTLKDAKVWLAITGDTDDALLQNLIRQVSGMILAYLGRKTVAPKQFTDTFAGNGGAGQMLKNSPLISVSNVAAGPISLPMTGYWLDQDAGIVNLLAYVFPPGPCSITYTAGYLVSGEPQSAADSVLVDAPDGQWMADAGVTYSSGEALAFVAANPGQGQYALGERGEYQFADADADASVLISYSFVPAPLEQACLEILNERYAYRSRPGQSSVNVSGQVVAFRLTDMPDYARTLLQPFRRMVPI